jgi:4-amino-4-deoxy-L-arabinose transferase-like glycosyltransferase
MTTTDPTVVAGRFDSGTPSIGGPAVSRLLVAAPWMMFLAALLICGSIRLFDRDETYYSRAAQEMLDGGGWLVPQVNGQTFAHKPPLAFWLMASSMRAFGENEFAARLPSAVALLLAGLLTGVVACRLFGSEVGLWSRAIFMGAAMPLLLGASAMLDMVLLLFILLGVWAFVEQVVRPSSWRWAWMPMAVAMGGSMLTKFPVGPAVLLPMFLVAVAVGGREIWAGWRPLAGTAFATLLGLAAFLAWAIPANRATGGEMAQTGVMVHIVGRALAPMEGHGGRGVAGYLLTLPVYLPVIVAGLFPWVVHLPAGCSALVRRHLGTARSRAILWAWIATPLMLFSLAATKLPHYVLPIFPALAMLAAAGLAAYRQGRLSEKDRDWLRGGAFFHGAVAALAASAIVAASLMAGGALAIASASVAAAALALVAALVVKWQLSERIREVNALLLVATPVLAVLAMELGVGAVDRAIKPGPEIAELLRSRHAAQVPIYAHGYREPGLFFYIDRDPGAPVLQLPAEPEEIAEWSRERSRAFLVITEHHLAEIEASAGPLGLVEVGRVPTIHVNKGGRSMRLLVLERAAKAL